MKAILTTITLLVGTVMFGQTLTVKAFFEGYDADEKIYMFKDASGDYYEFAEADKEVVKTYQLASSKQEGKAFTVTYSVEEKEDEEGYPYEVLTITKLQPTTLVAEEEEEYEED